MVGVSASVTYGPSHELWKTGGQTEDEGSQGEPRGQQVRIRNSAVPRPLRCQLSRRRNVCHVSLAEGEKPGSNVLWRNGGFLRVQISRRNSQGTDLLLCGATTISFRRLRPDPGQHDRIGLLRNLADTIARLTALRRQQASNPGFHIAERLSVLSEFGENLGGLASRFYLPDDYSPGRPLVVVLHGCTQSADAYDHHSGWSQLADQEGFALLYPEQQRLNNPNLCFNWFRPGDASRDRGEALSIRNMIGAMVARHGIDRSRIFITGLSAGGAMAAVMLATYPEVFAGGAIIAGLPHGVAATVPEAFDRMRGHGGPNEVELRAILRRASPHSGPWPTISIWHGTADQTVVPSNAEDTALQWQSVHGVSGSPTLVNRTGNHATRTWTNAAGEPVIEINLISGMGHGTPLRRGDVGTPGPFMLDVGIPSTRAIAGFWGIAPTADVGSSAVATQALEVAYRSLPTPNTTALARMPSSPLSGDPAPSTTASSSGASGARKIIEDALRAAGLMQ